MQNYLQIATELQQLAKMSRTKAEDNKLNAKKAMDEAFAYENRALFYEEENNKNEAQKCRDKKAECIQISQRYQDNANQRQILASAWEKVVTEIFNQHSDVLQDIDRLERLMQKHNNEGCDINDCPEIIRLIKKYLLQEYMRYQDLLNRCQDGL